MQLGKQVSFSKSILKNVKSVRKVNMLRLNPGRVAENATS